MEEDRFYELMEKAKQESKEDFLRFATNVYGVDESLFDHLWEVPVIAPWDGDKFVTTSLSTKTKEEILEIVDEFIDSELEDADGCFIPLEKMEIEFTDEELEEIKTKLDRGELKLDYDAIIVYNETKLKKQYKELLQENSTKGKSQEKVDKIFLNYLKSIITHERCHLNVSYLINEVRNNNFVSEEINGAEISSWEEDDLVAEKRNTIIEQFKRTERNEVFVDTLSQMINKYQEGDSIEDCLYKIINERGEKSQYLNMDDREVLVMYTLFPEELTEWATFGAYEDRRENKLQKMILEVCGTDKFLEMNQFKKKVMDYIETLDEGTLSEKQIQMLEMLGFQTSRKIGIEDMKDVATSNEALGALAGSYNDIKAAIQENENIKE